MFVRKLEQSTELNGRLRTGSSGCWQSSTTEFKMSSVDADSFLFACMFNDVSSLYAFVCLTFPSVLTTVSDKSKVRSKIYPWSL